MNFTLSVPPPINAAYRAAYSAKKRRVVFFMTAKSRAWKVESHWMMKKNGFGKHLITDPVSIKIKLYLKHNRDVDGSIKIILDALQDTVLENDMQVQELYVSKQMDKLNPRVDVEVNQL